MKFLREGFLLMLLVVCTGVMSNAQTMSGNGTKAWFGATNWTSPAAQPTTGGAVIISSTGSLTINMNSVTSVTLASFTVGGSADVTMNSSGSATITTGALTINRSFDFSRPFVLTGTGTVASGQTLTRNAAITLNSGATLTINGTLAGSSNILVKSGAVLIFGSNVNAPSNVTVEAGGEVRFTGTGSSTTFGASSTISGKLSLQGSRGTASGFVPSWAVGSTLEYKGSSAQTANYYELPVSNGPTNVIIDNTLGVTFSNGGGTPNPTISGTLTLTNGVLTLGNNVSAGITFTGATPISRTNGTINASGTWATLRFNAATGNQTIPNGTFNNTTITELNVNMLGAGGTLFMNTQDVTIGELNLVKGFLSLGTGSVTFGSVTSFPTSGFSTANMVLTPSTGTLRYAFPTGATSAITFPLGETTTTTEYSPITLAFASNSLARTIGFRVTDGVHASVGSPGHYISRYFNMYASGTTGTYEYSIAAKYNGTTGDVVGTEASSQPAVYTGSVWNLYPGSMNTASDLVEYTSATETTGPLGNGYVYMGRFVTAALTTWYLDADSDGWYTSTQDAASSPGAGWTSTLPTGGSGDCAPNDATMHASYSFYTDTDGDGYGAGSATSVCAVNAGAPPSGYSVNNTDCSPSDNSTWQSALLYIDSDNDNYTNGTQTVCYGASIPVGYKASSLGIDCNDSNVNVWQSTSLYVDNDGDGRTVGSASAICHGASIPAGYIANSLGSDCDDNNIAVWQSATLYIDFDADGYDNGSTTVCYGSSIPTGYSLTTSGGDCNDNNSAVHPGVIDVCGDGIDNNCNGVAEETCPTPGNDNPAPNNPVLSSLNYVYPNCYNVQGTTSGATINPTTGSTDVWYQFTAISNGVSIKVNSSVIDAKIYLYNENATTLLNDENLTVTGNEILNFGGLTAGLVYRVAVGSLNGTAGPFSICLQQLRIPSCGTSAPYGLCTAFKSTVTGSTTTTYSFTQGVTTTTTTSANPITLGQTSLQLQYGGTYTVGLISNYVLTNGLGQNETIQVSNPSACAITISDHPAVEVRSTQRCENGATLYRSSYLQGVPVGGSICGVTGYSVEFTPVSNCAGANPQNLETFVRTISSATASISLNYVFSNIPLAGNSGMGYWNVRWRPKFGTQNGEWGNPHVIAVNGTAPAGMITESANETLSTFNSSSTIKAEVYPNPNVGDMVNLNLTGITSPHVYVKIMDGMGRVVYTTRYSVDGSLNTIITFSSPLANGMYLIEFTTTSQVITEKMMVTR